MAKKIDAEAAPDLSNHKQPGIVTFTEQELANMDESEKEVALHMNSLAAEGIDPTLDDEEIAAIRAQRAAGQEQAAREIAQQPEPKADDKEIDPPEANAGKDKEQSAPDDTGTLQADTVETGDEPVLLPVADIAAMDTQRKELRKQERELQKKWVDGELDQEAYDQQLAALQDQIDSVTTSIGAATAIQQQNQLTQLRHQQATINAIRARGAEIGIDYNQPAFTHAFNTAMDLIEATPENAALTFAQIAEKAHAMVAAMNGITQTKAPSPTPSPAPAIRRQPPPVPRTLGKVPAAEIPNQGSQAQDLGEQLFAGKNAAEAELAWEALSPAQKKALLGEYA